MHREISWIIEWARLHDISNDYLYKSNNIKSQPSVIDVFVIRKKKKIFRQKLLKKKKEKKEPVQMVNRNRFRSFVVNYAGKKKEEEKYFQI